MKIDLLVIAVHPDDAELSCSGTLLKHKALGKKTGVIDLTRGELGTRGNETTRAAEAADAARILKLDVRENLGMRDGFFKNDEEHQLMIIRKIRQYEPEIVITNALTDRHPDHGRAAGLVNDAAFLSGLVKIKTELDGKQQNAWRPRLLLNFIQNAYIKPDIIIDITPFWEEKMASIAAYKTQFYNPDANEEHETYISSPEFVKVIEAKARELGISINTNYAEGFTSSKLLGVDNLFELK
ncbi:bacillithiol biosynthesis deacetylase BshB1 [Arcticibacter tournemirensis]|uniref:Bacillithiol biosynthesis deacetylase BshB1 n=1 Tax=Arcticibacter tournemirensis TaxID=699437 RepID=A0A4V1KIH5_9SPHI|nr:bacillithiol biosynthesis deacetylase BshB1 [Arcticibacter tournemirensis]RXF70712.1 bacillithiol biosynthesis deacetylase BshB1 [Arcticibacter tournemirensis]